jgi:hypothetical protein
MKHLLRDIALTLCALTVTTAAMARQSPAKKIVDTAEKDWNTSTLTIVCGSNYDVVAVDYYYPEKNIMPVAAGRVYYTRDWLSIRPEHNTMNLYHDTVVSPNNSTALTWEVFENNRISSITNPKMDEPIHVVMTEAMKICGNGVNPRYTEKYDVPKDQQKAFNQLRDLMRRERIVQ